MSEGRKIVQCINEIVAIFRSYAKQEGHENTLTNAEAKKFVTEQLGFMLENPNNPDEANALVDALDMNSDHEMDFKEFMVIFMGLFSLKADMEGLIDIDQMNN
ncbi:unnamed protein product [Ophioblennius macclurei]